MNRLRKLTKLVNFVGWPDQSLPPVLMNSMPKAGTNLLEELLIALGYKRNWARCLTEHNITKTHLKPVRGRFYVGHLPHDEQVPNEKFASLFLRRDLWDCLKSYVNYMAIDTDHPISRFVCDDPTAEMLERLLFTEDNPNGRSLTGEYLRFSELDLSRYDLVIDYPQLLAGDLTVINSLADTLGCEALLVAHGLEHAKGVPSHTKNRGRVNLFREMAPETVETFRRRVCAAAKAPSRG